MLLKIIAYTHMVSAKGGHVFNRFPKIPLFLAIPF